MDSKRVCEILIDAVSQYRGDDYERAKRQFSGYTSLQMSKQWGQSGKTCQEILDGYKRRADECAEVVAIVHQKFL